MLDPDACYEALRTRDARFDGRFFVGVTSTGIYCRPVCPAGPPKRQNCRFFPTAAAAHEAGFRPCLRCRPETAPDTPSWSGTSSTVSRALSLIEAGALDEDGASIGDLAERLGVGERQLRRLFQQHLGASPIAVAQTRRLHFAKQLVHETDLPISEIALASGFGSVRRFNDAFRTLFQRPPSALRRRVPAASPKERGVVVRLRYRPPYDWDALLAHLRGRAVDGVEHVSNGTYARTVWLGGHAGTVEVSHEPERSCLRTVIRFPVIASLPSIVRRIRRAFDLAADVTLIGAHLSKDPCLAPLVAARPGLRVPGGWDPFELAVRAIYGQQVSVVAARRIGARLCERCGPLVESGGLLTRAFPGPADVAQADLSSVGLTGARARALAGLARAALADPLLFEPQDTIESTVARLRTIPGVGDWTAHYIALRAAREPDAFPASDLGLLRGAARGSTRPSPSALARRAERWRPWRAYAAQHLWTADIEP